MINTIFFIVFICWFAKFFNNMQDEEKYIYKYSFLGAIFTLISAIFFLIKMIKS